MGLTGLLCIYTIQTRVINTTTHTKRVFAPRDDDFASKITPVDQLQEAISIVTKPTDFKILNSNSDKLSQFSPVLWY